MYIVKVISLHVRSKKYGTVRNDRLALPDHTKKYVR